MFQPALPIELLEMLLIRTIVAFFMKTESRDPRDAETVAMTTVTSVCHLWFQVFARRKFNQQRVRRLLHRTYY